MKSVDFKFVKEFWLAERDPVSIKWKALKLQGGYKVTWAVSQKMRGRSQYDHSQA